MPASTTYKDRKTEDKKNTVMGFIPILMFWYGDTKSVDVMTTKNPTKKISPPTVLQNNEDLQKT